eukprot:4472552-Prymnesium_polylepis.1
MCIRDRRARVARGHMTLRARVARGHMTACACGAWRPQDFLRDSDESAAIVEGGFRALMGLIGAMVEEGRLCARHATARAKPNRERHRLRTP